MLFARLLLFSYISLFILGGFLAYAFSSVTEQNQYPSLINLIGLSFDFIGVLLLSEQFIKIPEKFKLIKDLVLGIVLGIPFMLSMGVVIYTIPAIYMGWPISDLWQKAMGIVVLYVGVTLYGFESLADIFGMKFMSNIKVRIAYYGWFMLLTGLAFQIYSSLMQLEIT